MDKTIWRLSGALWMMILSAVTFNRIGEISLSSLLTMPETIIYLIFGILHALLAFDRKNFSVLNFICDIILFSSFYRLILLPACGFAYIEWSLLLIVFAQEAGITLKINSEKFSHFQLIFFGLLLWGVKIIIRYALPQNIYASLSNNATILNLILAMASLTALFGVKRLIDCVLHCGIGKNNSEINLPAEKTSRISKNSKSLQKSRNNEIQVSTSKKFFVAAKNLLLKTIKFAGRTISKFFQIIFQLFSGPTAITIILVILLLSGIAAFFLLKKIHDDLMKVLQDILRIALTTDNASYTESDLNTLGQCGAIIIFISIIVQSHLKKN